MTQNKSSSFYSEVYHEKMRQRAKLKPTVYRERHKELYDQQHELQILRYYKNTCGRCQMMRYFDIINEVYMKLKQKNIRNNEDYNNGVEEFIQNMKKAISHFHRDVMAKDYITRDQYISLNLHSAKETKLFWKHWEVNLQQKQASAQDQQRVESCNQCPIFVEEFQFNFEKSLDLVKRNCEYWDQLNGHQKVNKIRSHMQQNLKVLNYELDKKCEYSTSTRPLMKMKRPRFKRRK